MPTPRRLSVFALSGLLALLVLSVATCRLDMLIKPSAQTNPVLSVDPTEVRDSARAGSDDIRRASIEITNTGDGDFTWSVTKDKGWISVTPTEGNPPATLDVSLDAHSLAPGTYQGSVTVHAPGSVDSTVAIAVTFVVQRAGLVVSPGSVTHSTNVTNDTVFQDNLQIANTGNGPLVWTASKRRSWVTLSPIAGTGPGSVTVTVNSAGLAAGIHSDTVTVSAPGAEGSPAKVAVTLTIFAPGLAVTPALVRDSALAGSTAARTETLHVTNSGTGTITWTAATTEPWVTLSKTAGGAPEDVVVTLTPTGLPAGTHRDTIVFTSPEATTGPLNVPVTFVIQRPCTEIPIAPDEVRTGTLAPPDCEAPHRPGSLANLYSLSANAGDTLSIRLTATFDAYLVLTDGAGAVLAQNDECLPETGTACIMDFPVPATGRYLIEATSAAAGETGPLTISVVRERPPAAPQAIGQFHKDGTTAIAIGAATVEDAVVFRGRISDPNDADSVRLEIELEPLGSPFTNASTHQSPFVSAGSGSVTVSVPAAGLTNNTGYHWQARTCDRTGRCSPWLAFGGNAETAADFTVLVAPPPPGPGAPLQQGAKP